MALVGLSEWHIVAMETVVFKLWIHGPLEENTLTASSFVTEKNEYVNISDMLKWISSVAISK